MDIPNTQGYHPSHDVANKKGLVIGMFDGDDDDAVAHVFDWFAYDENSPFLNQFCTSVQSRRTTKCDCLSAVIKTMDSSPKIIQQVSYFVVYLSRLHKYEQVGKVMDWKNYLDILGSSDNSCTYCLPLLTMNNYEIIEDEEDTVESFKICHNSLLAILGKGRAFWSTCCKAAEANQVPAHGLKGRPSNRALDQDSETFLSLHFFFGDMEELAEPRATRIIRESTKTD